MPVDWASCEDDVIRLYVEGTKTERETRGYLHEKYGIKVTPKQFKSKFGGLKNLRANEWKVVTREIRKREEQGKASEVYFLGRKLDPERVAREIRRYSKVGETDSPVENDAGIDLGVDSPCSHRIDIRTPVSPDIGSPLLADSGVSHIPAENAGPSHTDNTGALAELADGGIDLDAMELDFSTPRIESQALSFGYPDSPGLLISEETGIQHCGSLSLVRTRSKSLDIEGLLPQHFLRSLPHRSPQIPIFDLSVSPGSPPALINATDGPELSLALFWDSLDICSLTRDLESLSVDNEFWSTRPDRGNVGVPEGRRGSVLSHLIDVDPKLEILKPFADFIEVICKERWYPQEHSFTDAGGTSLNLIFSIVIYLASNSLLGSDIILEFLGWVENERHLDQLRIFLQKGTANIRAFTMTALQAASTGVTSSPVILRLLSTVKREDISGQFGGELLLKATSSRLEFVVMLLLSRGADINAVVKIGERLDAPLCRAARLGDAKMVKYLISDGADVNIRFKAHVCGGEENALTAAILAGKPDVAALLLDNGAEIDLDFRDNGCNILEIAKQCSTTMYELLLKRLGPEKLPCIVELVQAAERGNHALSRILLERGIVQEEVLESVLCQAVRLGSLGAVGTLLRRGVDPDARRSQLIRHNPGRTSSLEDAAGTQPILLAASTASREVSPDLIYLLMEAGANITDDVLMHLCRAAINNEQDDALYILAKAGHNTALVGPSALEYLAESGEIYKSGFFLAIGAPINAYGMNGRNGLQVAAGCGNLPLAQYLIDRGADVNLPASDNGGRTALQAAASKCDTAMVDYLIHAGADVRAAPAKVGGVTVLEAAADAARSDSDNDSDDSSNDDSDCKDGDRDESETASMFKNLLALGAPPNRTDGAGGTVLHRLIRRSRIECLKLALLAGARIEDRESSEGMNTPLQVAVMEGDVEAIKLLLEHGADVNAPAGEEFGRTALQAAASSTDPDPDIVELLLLRGADVNAQPGGITALQGAAIRGQFRIARMLLSRGADVNAAPAKEDGRTAVEAAAEHGRLDMVRLLLGAHAKVDPTNGLSRAISLAEENGHFALADMLREHEVLFIGYPRQLGQSQEDWGDFLDLGF